MQNDNILEVKDLHVDIKMSEGLLTAVRGVNFEMKKGETLGLVGESGCGKSLTCKAILGINDRKCTSSGEILFDSDGLGEVELISLAKQKQKYANLVSIFLSAVEIILCFKLSSCRIWSLCS